MNIISRIAVLSLVSCAFASTSMVSAGSDEIDQPVHTFSVMVPEARVNFGDSRPDELELFGVFVKAGKKGSLFESELPEDKIIVDFGQVSLTESPHEGMAIIAQQVVAKAVQVPEGVDTCFFVKARLKNQGRDTRFVQIDHAGLENPAGKLLREVEVVIGGKICYNHFDE